MNVLITGATGVVGTALLRQLLGGDTEEVRVLIRGTDQSHADLRAYETLDELIQTATTPAEAANLSAGRGRLKIYLGDVTLPHLGLTESAYLSICRDLSHVVHAAASVKMNMSLDAARTSCLFPVQQIIALADDCASNGRPLERVVFVSTIGVVGNVTGHAAEVPFRMPRTFRNTYEETKAEAEELILAAVARGLPATLLRPSMVLGDSQSGWTKRGQVFYTLCEIFSGRHTAGAIPSPVSLSLDVIPSDYVARALVILLRAPEAVGRIFHACAGPSLNLSFDEDLVPLVREVYARRNLVSEEIRRVPLTQFADLLPQLMTAPDRAVSGFAKAASYLIPYLDKVHFFENQASNDLFRRHGLEVPEPRSYLERVVDTLVVTEG